MRREFLIIPFLLAGLWVGPAGAQQPGTATAVITSEPGKATAAQTVEMSARVVEIDKATRTVTLKGPKGNTVDIACGDEVKNFDQIKIGDTVTAKYTESLTLELAKTKAGVRSATESGNIERAAPGQKPAGSVTREVVILADVIAVDPAKQTITLKGPKGNVVTLPVHNPDQFKVVKKGDQVQATYTQAMAVSVTTTPAAK